MCKRGEIPEEAKSSKVQFFYKVSFRWWFPHLKKKLLIQKGKVYRVFVKKMWLLSLKSNVNAKIKNQCMWYIQQ